MKELNNEEILLKKSEIANLLNEDVVITQDQIERILVDVYEYFDFDEGLYVMVNPSKMPLDSKIEFIYEPTYLLLSLTIKSISSCKFGPEITMKCECIINKITNFISKYGFITHGYDRFQNLIDALNILRIGKVLEYAVNYHYDNLRNIILKVATFFRESIEKNNCKGDWGENYTVKCIVLLKYIYSIIDLPNPKIFVYGTLVRGGGLYNKNPNGTYLGDAILKDHKLVRVSEQYPGMIDSLNDMTLGEVYETTTEDIRNLDIIEGNGFLYDRTIELVEFVNENRKLLTYAYVLKEYEDTYRTISENIWDDKMVLYFAYGSCMNTSDFRKSFSVEEYKKTRMLGVAKLGGYRLSFSRYSSGREGGVLDIVESPNDTVIGIVYELPFIVLTKVLDKREGHPRIYNRKQFLITLEDGSQVKAFSYQVLNRRTKEIKPSFDYAQIVLNGMRENNFPSFYIGEYRENLIKNFSLEL